MNRLWRALLLCVLALALPLQGAAAGAMLHCAAIPDHAPAAAGDVSPHDAAPTHAGAMAEAIDTSAASLDASAASLDSSVDATGVAGAAHDAAASSGVLAKAHAAGAGHQCSACAACCVGMGIAGRCTPALPDGEPASLPQPVADAAPRSFIAGGLERPPRADFA